MITDASLYELGALPVDRTAFRVMLPGVEFTPNIKVDQLLFDAPPIAGDFRRKPWEQQPEDLRGRKKGTLKVIGYWCRGTSNSGRSAQKWVCRCNCGLHVIRTAKSIVEDKDPDDTCTQCRYLAYLKKMDRLQQVGRYEYPIGAEKNEQRK